MRYVVCYDIADDRRRERVAKALLDFGQRIQESVFVADLDDELAKRMQERLRALLERDQPDEKVHLFRLCRQCAESGVCLGAAEPPGDEEYYVV
jgi:CRISPR-associated protein Cas2